MQPYPATWNASIQTGTGLSAVNPIPPFFDMNRTLLGRVPPSGPVHGAAYTPNRVRGA